MSDENTVRSYGDAVETTTQELENKIARLEAIVVSLLEDHIDLKETIDTTKEGIEIAVRSLKTEIQGAHVNQMAALKAREKRGSDKAFAPDAGIKALPGRSRGVFVWGIR